MAAILTQGKFKIGRNEPCPCGSGKKFKKCCGNEPPKPRLAETLDRTLEPRVAPGNPGRPKGAGNYEWTPEMDKVLTELWTKFRTASGGLFAKVENVMAKRLMELFPHESNPRKDSLRRAVRRRMAFLGLSGGNPPRKKAEPNPAERAKKAPEEVRSGAWTPGEISALLGTLGGDLIKETIVERTRHSIEACYAKIKRLGHTVHELRSVSFTVDELAEMLRVSTRRIRTWKEKGWLQTTRRRITGKDLVAFFKKHHELVTFAALPLEIRTFLMDLGYPAAEASSFKANVKAILETVGGRKRRSDAQTSSSSDSSERPSKRILDKIVRWNQLKEQRIGPQRSPWHYLPWPSSLASVAQAAV